jgi:DNA-directed RNA polymerase alpha subunit
MIRPAQYSNFPRLASPALRALAGAGYTRLEQLSQISEADLLKLHGVGPNALEKLRQALKEKGLAFAKTAG